MSSRRADGGDLPAAKSSAVDRRACAGRSRHVVYGGRTRCEKGSGSATGVDAAPWADKGMLAHGAQNGLRALVQACSLPLPFAPEPSQSCAS